MPKTPVKYLTIFVIFLTNIVKTLTIELQEILHGKPRPARNLARGRVVLGKCQIENPDARQRATLSVQNKKSSKFYKKEEKSKSKSKRKNTAEKSTKNLTKSAICVIIIE